MKIAVHRKSLALAALALSGCASAALSATLPATANAYATIAPSPLYSSAPGLPDGRVYEQVSPANKNGNQAGATTDPILASGGLAHYALAAANGDSVLFEGTGAIGETSAGYNLYFVAQRSIGGWSTRSILPRAQQSTTELGAQLNVQPIYVDPSPDLSHVMFQAHKGTYTPPPSPKCQGRGLEGQLYLSGPAPELMTTWLNQPETENPIERCETLRVVPVGGTPDFSTVYFGYSGTLLPEDASRAPNVGIAGGGASEEGAWGFYEDREGVLREAGVLPDGSLDPFGAVPAASGHGRATAGNQVSADGSRAFFVSPDPASCEGGENDCASDPPELYVRENGEKTLLVSRDTLLPEAGGLPAPAPSGAYPMINPAIQEYLNGGRSDSYVFASSDGSQAFFQSEDDLTEEALRLSPGTEPKTYDFDLNTGLLTYLPNVAGQIVATDTHGSSFAFVRPEAGGAPAELDLWSGPGGGSVTPITKLVGTPPGNSPASYVPEARMSSDGSVVVFTSPMQVPGGFNSGTSFEQIYLYDLPTNTLACVSCAPVGVVPTGSAELSTLQANEKSLSGAALAGLVDERGISSDGSRIFFDTPTPLVPQATNAGVRDVYEWENGEVYLISSGTSPNNSYFLDNSESGGDVFFATTEGLVPSDTDGGYDVYDARVPQPGDNPPPAAVPCEGSVCQGPPPVATPLSAPASATFSGLGNLAPEPVAAPAAKPRPKPRVAKCKKGSVRKKSKCIKSKAKKSKAKKSSKRSKGDK